MEPMKKLEYILKRATYEIIRIGAGFLAGKVRYGHPVLRGERNHIRMTYTMPRDFLLQVVVT